MTLLSRLVVTILFCASVIFAQQSGNKAEIAGTVYDPNSAVVPNAVVKVRNTGTGLERETKSNEAGQFRFPALDPGIYELEAKFTGFGTKRITDIQLAVGTSPTIDVNLAVQESIQSVDVSETAVNLTVAQPTANVGLQQIQNLPINGRRFQDFATLTPTVQVDPSRSQLSFAGQRGVNGNVMLDGSDYSQPFFGGIRGGERSNFALTVPQSAIQEFQVVTAGYNAEYGRSTGGILNAITRSGTNSFFGDAFWQYRPRDLAEKYPIPVNVLGQLQKLTLPENLYQYGGGVGGPIIKDRMFFFGAVERQVADQNRRVGFINLAGFTPNAASQAGFNYYRAQENAFTSNNNAYAYTLRTDLQSTKGHRLTLRFNSSENRAENAVTVGGVPAPVLGAALSNEGVEGNRTYTGTAQYTHIFTPSLINDTRFSTQYEERPRSANSSLPLVNLASVGAYGTRNFLPTVQDDWRFQILNSSTWTVGKHTIKFGIDAARISTAQTFAFNQFGAFNVNNSTGLNTAANVQQQLDALAVGGTVANLFDYADVNYLRQVGNGLADFKTTAIALFAQDSWRVTNNFTLDFGLRWEGQYNPDPVADNTTAVNLIRNTVFPTGFRLDPSTIPNATDQWMPRAGFAWNPLGNSNRRLVIRGNAGVFYAFTPLLWFSGPTNNFRATPGDVSIQLTGRANNTIYQQLLAAGFDLNRFALDNLPVIPLDVVQRAFNASTTSNATNPLNGNILNGTNVVAIANDFRNPMSYQSGIGMEMEVTKNWIAGVQYQQVNTLNLGRNRDWNLPVPTVRPADGRPIFVRANRPIPSLNQITVRESSARGLYRALIFQSQYRTKRYQFQAFYTLSENFSNADTERDTGGTEYENNYNLLPEYNYSRLDARHNFTANGVAFLPWGFETSSILRLRSGAPFNVLTGADTNGDNYFTDRPYSAVGVPFLRNSDRNRGFKSVDLRVVKSFQVRERFKIQASAEFFNLFNWDNVVFGGSALTYGTGVNTTTGAVTGPTFTAPDPTANGAQVISFRRLKNANGDYATYNTILGSPRQIQVGVRFFF